MKTLTLYKNFGLGVCGISTPLLSPQSILAQSLSFSLFPDSLLGTHWMFACVFIIITSLFKGTPIGDRSPRPLRRGLTLGAFSSLFRHNSRLHKYKAHNNTWIHKYIHTYTLYKIAVLERFMLGDYPL